MIAFRNLFDNSCQADSFESKSSVVDAMNKPFRAPRTRTSSTRFSADFLDAATEADLARAWRERGDARARDRLVLAHRALAWAAAARMTRGQRRPDEDLIQQANLGLLKAADRFDPDMGFRFSTYATWWVRAEIQDYAYGDWSLIRLPGSSSRGGCSSDCARPKRRSVPKAPRLRIWMQRWRCSSGWTPKRSG